MPIGSARRAGLVVAVVLCTLAGGAYAQAPAAAAAPEHFDWECTMRWSAAAMVVAARDDGQHFQLGFAERAGEPLTPISSDQGARVRGSKLVISDADLKSGNFLPAMKAAGVTPAAVAHMTLYVVTIEGWTWGSIGLSVFTDKAGKLLGTSGFPQKIEGSLPCGPSVPPTRSDGPLAVTATLAIPGLRALGLGAFELFGNGIYVGSVSDRPDANGKKTFTISKLTQAGSTLSATALHPVDVVWPTKDDNLAAECHAPWSISDDGKDLVYWAEPNKLSIVNALSGSLEEEIPFTPGDGCNLGFSHDGHYVYQIGNNSQTRLWQRSPGHPAKLVQTFQVTERTQYNSVWLTFTADNRQVLVNDYFHHTLKFWDLKTQRYTGPTISVDNGITPVDEVFLDARTERLFTKDMGRRHHAGVISLRSTNAHGTQPQQLQLDDVDDTFGFSAGDHYLFANNSAGHPVVLDAATGNKIQELSSVMAIAGGVLRDGRLILLGNTGLTVWELPKH